MLNNVRKIISGGQTVVDRAALDFARFTDIAYGGFVPKGRLAEDGRIPDRYQCLTETETATDDPQERTRLNVSSSDATLILSHGSLSGGSRLTRDIADGLGKPVLHVDFRSSSQSKAIDDVSAWLSSANPEVLNIAGPRASEGGAIYETALAFLLKLHKKGEAE